MVKPIAPPAKRPGCKAPLLALALAFWPLGGAMSLAQEVTAPAVVTPTAPVGTAGPALPSASLPGTSLSGPSLPSPSLEAAPDIAPVVPGATMAEGPQATGVQTTGAQSPDAPPPSLAIPHGLATEKLIELIHLAHPVVQAVMALLALAAFVVLVVLIHKSVELPLARARLRARIAALDLTSPPRAQAGSDPGARMLSVAATRPGPAALRLMCQEIEAEALAQWKSGTGLLTQIAATAPFVGLFGTVFGIMNSFLAIAETKTTNLAVVAPGIAEALFATAIGLVAAIPAVWVHNHLVRRIAVNRLLLAQLAARIELAAQQPGARLKEAA